MMFDVKEGGESVPVKWGKELLTDDKSIIILDETNQIIWLWNGKKQGLVARRTALRQAESLKGHGYTVGKSIIGRDIRGIREIDQRKLGRDPETDQTNKEIMDLFNKPYRELEGLVITFSEGGTDVRVSKVVSSSAPTASIHAEPMPESKPVAKPAAQKLPKPEIKVEPTHPVKEEVKSEAAPKIESVKEEARIAFVLKAVLNHYDDIWVSKKKDGSYGVEIMDGKLCEFSITDAGSIKFSSNSFTGISQNIKTEIQRKFVELSKLIQ
ncbi:MAG TPA: hypothetical protein VGB37_07740 [Candidatus Lokiarchaeia archaeon]